MNVAFVARKGNVEVLPEQLGLRGYSVQRITSVLYKKLIEHKDKDVTIKLIELGKGKTTFSRQLTMIPELLYHKMNKYDIIHAPTPLPLKPLRLNNRAKVVTTSHGISSINVNSPCYQLEHHNHDFSFRGAIAKRLASNQTLSSDFIIAVSSLTKKRIVELGFDEDKVFVVNNGLDERFINTQLPKKDKRKKKFVVGYLGPFYLNKNIIFAINAFKKIRDNDMIFEIWGKKTYEYQVLQKAAKEDKRIRFMGIAPERDLVKIYDRFDAFVYPTTCDQFPGSVMEAQSRGLPVVSFKYGEMSEESKKYCFEAEDEKNMAEIIWDIKYNQLADKLLPKITLYAKSFTSDRQAKETLDVYKKVLAFE